MSKILYPIFKLPSENEDDVEYQAIPTWIKWWLLNNYNKKHSWVLSEIITGNPLTLENSVATKFYLPPLPRGNSEQVQYSGKNKFNINDTPANHQGTTNTTSVIENGVRITATANSGDTTKYSFAVYKILDLTNYVGKVIRMKANFLASANTLVPQYRIGTCNANGGGRSAKATSTVSGTEISYTVSTVDENSPYLAIWLDLTQGTDITIGDYVDFTNVIVTIDNSDMTYEPYTYGQAPNPNFEVPITNVTGDVEVLVQNKNLVDISDDNSIIGSSAYNKFTINNQVIATTGGTLVGFRAKVKPNSVFTMQAFSTFSSGTTNQIRLREYSKYPSNWDDNYILQTNKGLTNNGIATQTVTTSATTEWVLVVIYASGSGCTISNIQLEQNTTATTYTPHTERTYTFPLGTQRMFLGDYLADDGIHHVRKQVVFDGSENITANSMTDNVYRYVVPTSNRKSNGVALSNYFKQISVFNAGVGLFNGVGLNLCIENITTVADFKTWLSTHNVTVEYELATEEITPYTTEQQQAYDEIKQAISYEEQTNISGSSDESNPIFEVQYYMKNESEGE